VALQQALQHPQVAEYPPLGRRRQAAPFQRLQRHYLGLEHRECADAQRELRLSPRKAVGGLGLAQLAYQGEGISDLPALAAQIQVHHLLLCRL